MRSKKPDEAGTLARRHSDLTGRKKKTKKPAVAPASQAPQLEAGAIRLRIERKKAQSLNQQQQSDVSRLTQLINQNHWPKWRASDYEALNRVSRDPDLKTKLKLFVADRKNNQYQRPFSRDDLICALLIAGSKQRLSQLLAEIKANMMLEYDRYMISLYGKIRDKERMSPEIIKGLIDCSPSTSALPIQFALDYQPETIGHVLHEQFPPQLPWQEGRFCASPKERTKDRYSDQLERTIAYALTSGNASAIEALAKPSERFLLFGLNLRRFSLIRWLLPKDQRAQSAAQTLVEHPPEHYEIGLQNLKAHLALYRLAERRLSFQALTVILASLKKEIEAKPTEQAYSSDISDLLAYHLGPLNSEQRQAFSQHIAYSPYYHQETPVRQAARNIYEDFNRAQVAQPYQSAALSKKDSIKGPFGTDGVHEAHSILSDHPSGVKPIAPSAKKPPITAKSWISFKRSSSSTAQKESGPSNPWSWPKITFIPGVRRKPKPTDLETSLLDAHDATQQLGGPS